MFSVFAYNTDNLRLVEKVATIRKTVFKLGVPSETAGGTC